NRVEAGVIERHATRVGLHEAGSYSRRGKLPVRGLEHVEGQVEADVRANVVDVDLPRLRRAAADVEQAHRARRLDHLDEPPREVLPAAMGEPVELAALGDQAVEVAAL